MGREVFPLHTLVTPFALIGMTPLSEPEARIFGSVVGTFAFKRCSFK